MSRRADPRRIDEARRIATRNRLTRDDVTEGTADAWITAWEAQATRDGLEPGSAYWDAAWEWIAAEREHRARP